MKSPEAPIKPKSLLFVILPYLVWSSESKNNNTKSMLTFPYGVLSIASYIKKKITAAHKISILDLNLYPEEERQNAISTALATNQPDIVAISMMFDFSYKHLKEVSKTVKDYDNKIIVVVGGSSATVSWNMILQEQEYVDALCYGDGELPMLQLIETANVSATLADDPVWVTRQSLADKRTPQVKYLNSLNDVIDIDYELIDINDYGMKEAFSPFSSIEKSDKMRQFFLMTSRGCPFKCVFCAVASLNGRVIRYADVDNLINHVRHLVTKYGMNVLTLYDDQILFNRDRAKEFFRRLAEFKLRVETPNGVSVAYIDEEMAELMKAAGIDTAVLAIESGSDRMLKEVIHKPLRLDQVKPVIKILHRHKMFVQGYIVVGLPGELEEDRVETARFVKEVGLDWVNFNLATPLRGTELYRICLDNGYIDPNFGIGDLGMHEYVIRAPGLEPEDIMRKRYLMNLDVNFVNNHRMRVGDYEIARACFKDVAVRYEDQAFAHYYLAKALEALGGQAKAIKQAMRRVDEIINKDSLWQEYFDYFGVDIKAQLTSCLTK